MDKKLENAHIVACKTLGPEIELLMQRHKLDLPRSFVESGKHVWPDKLRVCIQESIDRVPRGRTILLVFGFCGNSLVGIKSGSHTLVLPQAADCIPLFLGGRKNREAYGIYTYFFTKGYLESEANFVKDYAVYVQKYGKKRSDRVMQEMMKHYKRIAVIDTGAFDPEEVKDAISPFARIIDVPVSIIPGNLRIIDMLLTGDWNPLEFLTIGPDSEVTFEMSLNPGALLPVRNQT
ncbi:hypothetical protein FACS1894200_14120 [Spirochaetia bacterium]|nr:hypothetical protein FACS1894200_14120 [Spirochaetia bacterium]